MEEKIMMIKNECPQRPADIGFADVSQVRKVREFHRSFPEYEPTPLIDLGGGTYIKDESKRFGLNAFKVLGASWAIGSSIGTAEPGSLTFVTATDGNHGRGVAWAARKAGQSSVVYMPRGSAQRRLENIRAEGADASITELNYDDAVRLAARMAREKGWILVQDTAFGDYEEIPRLIMQGYCTMALEAYEQLPEKPSHIFLQAGVGSMAAAVTAFFAGVYGEDRPVIAVVEPDKADCIFRTAEANDGQRHFVTGDMDTIMAGLACGEPCTLAWDILSQYADFFLSCPDSCAETGMRRLAEHGIVSGESGAAAFGCVAELLSRPEYTPYRDALGLDAGSRLLFFSTEGDTDPENYKRIVDGL